MAAKVASWQTRCRCRVFGSGFGSIINHALACRGLGKTLQVFRLELVHRVNPSLGSHVDGYPYLDLAKLACC